MEKFIPYEKLSKKEKRKIDRARRSQFATSDMLQRTVDNKKKYDRNKLKARREQDSGGLYFFVNRPFVRLFWHLPYGNN